jgi:hypothetical protein
MVPGLGIAKVSDPDWSGSGSRICHHSLRKHFWVKILKFFDADPGSGMEKIRIRDGKEFRSGINTGSAILIISIIPQTSTKHNRTLDTLAFLHQFP